MEIPIGCEQTTCFQEADTPFGDRILRVDRCILPELRTLWSQGIITVCSCCGHGDDDKAYIRVMREFADKMLALGYEPYEPHECPIWKGEPSYKAKSVRQERDKGYPVETRSLEEIRSLLKKAAGCHI